MGTKIITTNLIFTDITDIKKQKRTKVYNIHSKHDDAYLGCIKWINTWRCYAYQPVNDINMSADCLNEIIVIINMIRSEKSDMYD
jgi:hypothetical protein